MTKVVVGIALGKDCPTSDQCLRCIESLQRNTHKPDLIQVTYYATDPSDQPAMSLRRSVELKRTDKDLGILGSMLTFMSTHDAEADAALLIVDGSCTYPPHLIKEYLSCAPELHSSLIKEMPEANGSIYGMAGIIMTEDKKKYLDQMFESLTSKDGNEDEDAKHERLTVMSQTVNNATVHYLDPVGSIMIYRKQLQNDFVAYVAMVWNEAESLSMDVLLSNYFASKKIVRTQICNMFINRFMMSRMGCFDGYKAPKPADLAAKYLGTIKHLRSLDAFRVYD